MKVNQKVVLPASMNQVQSPQTQRISMNLQENKRRGAECIDQYMSTEDSRRLTNRYIERQRVYRPRQKHSGPFLLPWVRFKKMRSSLNLSSLYLEMRLFFKRSWDRYQEINRRVKAYRLCVVDRLSTDRSNASYSDLIRVSRVSRVCEDDERGSLMFEDKGRKEYAR